ncbi:hypothetical protein BQ8420_25305 [Nocardiopsis sp. JB363]|nr:hypothetical protein BQ8420_25305 [Nocardiopsis sp. JB363]
MAANHDKNPGSFLDAARNPFTLTLDTTKLDSFTSHRVATAPPPHAPSCANLRNTP